MLIAITILFIFELLIGGLGLGARGARRNELIYGAIFLGIVAVVLVVIEYGWFWGAAAFIGAWVGPNIVAIPFDKKYGGLSSLETDEQRLKRLSRELRKGKH